MFYSWTLLQLQKTYGFLTFSGRKKMDHSAKMSELAVPIYARVRIRYFY